MTTHYADDRVTVHHGDCLDVLRGLADSSVDAIVTDPPYGLGFMGREWDALPPGLPWAQECLRVLKPGGHLLAFGGTRTWHRLAVAVEDAGFEIRDSIAWLYGSGFPKSLDVSKAITGTQTGHGSNSGAIRRATMGDDYEPSGVRGNRDGVTRRSDTGMAGRGLTLTPDAEQWQGWGTALKPAFEPIVVGRKPLIGTVAGNVLTHGTGALNIDACRVEPTDRAAYEAKCASVVGLDSNRNGSAYGEWTGARADSASVAGRWPANVVLDDTQAAALDQQTGVLKSGSLDRSKITAANGIYGAAPVERSGMYEASEGGASRFFPTFRYQAKAPTRERVKTDDGITHPTVKPLDLMRWLVRLVTPPGGVVLEPFAGSGTTVEACLLEGFRCVAIEREADYLPLIDARIARATPSPVPDELDEVLF